MVSATHLGFGATLQRQKPTASRSLKLKRLSGLHTQREENTETGFIFPVAMAIHDSILLTTRQFPVRQIMVAPRQRGCS